MAEKDSTLSIVIRTVDKATAGIQAVNKRLDEVTRPTRELGKALSSLGDKSGFNSVMEGFSGVGGALKDLLGKLLVGGGILVGVGVGLHAIVMEFDALGDKAEQLGVSVDFLAAMGFAAERSGSDIATLNEGMTAFGENMGQLRAGKGRMLSFLQATMPDLVTMLKLTKGNEAAWLKLSEAMSKINDPQKRAALAAKTGVGSALAPMLMRGPEGLILLEDEFKKHAGPMEEAAEGAGKVDDALRNLKASTMGIKAAIITGLAPALEVLVKKLTEWLSGHREDVKRWATDIGEKLPAAVDSVIKAITKAVGWFTSFVDDIGGVKVALVGVAAVMVGPLVSALVTLGVAMMATPFGIVLAGLAAIAAAVALVSSGLKDMIELMDTSHEKMLEDLALDPEGFRAKHQDEMAKDQGFQQTRRTMDELLGRTGAAADLPAFAPGGLGPAAPRQAAAPSTEARIKVDFANVPRGTRVTADPKNSAAVDMNVGYQFNGAM